jgi:hypothetical protein
LKEFTPTPSPLETNSLDHSDQLFVFRRSATAGELPKPFRNAKFISQIPVLRILPSCAKVQFGGWALRETPTTIHQAKRIVISALTFSLLR